MYFLKEVAHACLVISILISSPASGASYSNKLSKSYSVSPDAFLTTSSGFVIPSSPATQIMPTFSSMPVVPSPALMPSLSSIPMTTPILSNVFPTMNSPTGRSGFDLADLTPSTFPTQQTAIAPSTSFITSPLASSWIVNPAHSYHSSSSHNDAYDYDYDDDDSYGDYSSNSYSSHVNPTARTNFVPFLQPQFSASIPASSSPVLSFPTSASPVFGLPAQTANPLVAPGFFSPSPTGRTLINAADSLTSSLVPSPVSVFPFAGMPQLGMTGTGRMLQNPESFSTFTPTSNQLLPTMQTYYMVPQTTYTIAQQPYYQASENTYRPVVQNKKKEKKKQVQQRPKKAKKSTYDDSYYSDDYNSLGLGSTDFSDSYSDDYIDQSVGYDNLNKYPWKARQIIGSKEKIVNFPYKSIGGTPWGFQNGKLGQLSLPLWSSPPTTSNSFAEPDQAYFVIIDDGENLDDLIANRNHIRSRRRNLGRPPFNQPGFRMPRPPFPNPGPRF